MQIEDQQFQGFKAFREHTEGIDSDLKAVKAGFTITAQDDATDEYTVAKPGDEAGWLFLEPNTREIGSYAQAVPALLLADGGSVVPLLNKAQEQDGRYGALTTGTSAGSSTTICRIAEESEGDIPGILVQCLNDEAYEYLFFPVGGGLLVADNVNVADSSTVIYEAIAGVGGGADTTKFGSFKEIFQIEHPLPYIKTAARYRYDTTKKGPLAFDSSAAPAASFGESLYKPSLHFNAVTGKWEWYLVITDGSGIVVDHTNVVDSSTKLYGAAVGGGVDLTNAGSSKEIFYIDTSVPYIGTTAKFRYDTTKKGALAFDSGAAPAASLGQTLYKPTLNFNSSTSKWEWYLILDDQTSSVYCRVAWNYKLEADRSEGEIMTLSGTTFAASGTTIWIDHNMSAACKHESAGTGTIFKATLVQAGVARFGVTRDLYRLADCVQDKGKLITHFSTFSRNTTYLEGYYLSSDLETFPPDQPLSSRIITRIGNSDKANFTSVRIPSEWSIATQDYKYLEIFDVSRSLPYYFAPIRPLLWDVDADIYKSALGEWFYAKS